ncbi:tetratricopeptide repeat protein [Labilibaculum manganireducens]|uniref:tetratricopeptide repeat protein n=1 Tax=Labilibaculum manganireducens TaxID=1940525 RepID=UPI0029F5815B|nr:tetratricopeptide repeat protein [Labilibaculum manganireducens]
MRYYIIFLFLTSSAFTSSKNYIIYHKKIQIAELLIRKGNYREALASYQAVFNDFEIAFYKDLHNASLCAIKDGNYDLAIKYCEKLVIQGYLLIDFNATGFSKLKSTLKWNRFVQRYDKLRSYYLSTVDQNMNQKLHDIFEKDQIAASSGNIEFQDSVFYGNALLLNKIYVSEGFPNCNIYKDTMLLNILAPLRHYFGLVNRLNDNHGQYEGRIYENMNLSSICLNQLFYDALIQGKILPTTYADNISYFDSENRFGKLVLRIDFDKEKVEFMPWINEERLNDINQLRVSVGLFPFDNSTSYLLNNTWYSKYPFREIKSAMMNCESCKSKLDYILLESRIASQFSEQYNKEYDKFGFILVDYSNVNHSYLVGIKPYMRNANNSNSK